VGQTDGRILLLERSGNFDLEKIMKSLCGKFGHTYLNKYSIEE